MVIEFWVEIDIFLILFGMIVYYWFIPAVVISQTLLRPEK